MADTGRVRCGECGVWQDRIRAADPRAEPGIECGLCMTTLAVPAGSPECDGCGLRIDGPCLNCGDGSGDGSDDGGASEIAAAAVADRPVGRDGAVDEATIDRFRPLEGDYFTMFGTHPKEPILEAIGLAETSIDVYAFWLTDKEIAEALVAAVARGVTVSVEVDRSNKWVGGSRQARKTMTNGNVPWVVVKPATGGHMHLKIIIVDCALLVTGSYNFTVKNADPSAMSDEVVHMRAADWTQMRDDLDARHSA